MATQVMSPGEPWPREGERKKGRRLALLVALALLVLLAGVLWTLGAEQRAINGMEPGKRTAVFQRSYASFEALCQEDPGGPLTSDCRQQARFLRQFPECDGACRELLSPYLPRWTR
jgi:hypothetical protein